MSNKVICKICPRECNLGNNQVGFCKARKNLNGQIAPVIYGYNTGLAIDPIEKKPLYHFHPNKPILSFGTLGCNVGCRFCQNWTMTKEINNRNLYQAFPQDIVNIAQTHACNMVAFTYNEPIIFFEYAINTAKLCHENQIKTVAVTSGYIHDKARAEFFDNMDAVNIDLKVFSEEFYRKNCLAHLQTVLDRILYVKNETNCHLEITTLLIEGENDSTEMLEKECKWILENLGTNVPLHFSAFHPSYKLMNKPRTSIETLLKAYNIAQKIGLNYVYLGNISNINTSTTYCKNCHTPLIIRDGFKTLENKLINGSCPICKTICDGIF